MDNIVRKAHSPALWMKNATTQERIAQPTHE